jgi:tetratricopeptide (TPR) repeat protein
LATVVLYAPVVGYEFLTYDDDRYVTDNAQVLQGLTLENLGWAARTQQLGIWHPLTWLSHMLDVELSGTSPTGHHAMSVLLHGVAALLLFQFFERATGAAGSSAFVAATFALHPLHVESVAWVSERKDVLSACLFMLSLCAYLGYCRKPRVGRHALVVLAFAGALLAKPTVVTLPFVLLLLDAWPLARTASLRSRVLEKLPLFALAAAASVAAFRSQQAGQAVAGLDVAPLALRIGNALVSYGAYAGLAFWPNPLAVLYPHPGELLTGWQVACAASGLALVSLVVLRAGPRAPFLPVGWLWFLGMLVPMIGLVQVGSQGMADRYTYLPLIGLALMVAWGVPELSSRWRYGRSARMGAALLALAALTATSSAQLRHWRNSVLLFEHALAVGPRAWLPLPDSPLVHFQLGRAYTAADRPEDALREYRTSLSLGGETAALYNNLANALVRVGRAEEAIRHYERALEQDPAHPNARANLDAVLRDPGLGAPAFAMDPASVEAQLRAARLEWLGGGHQAAIQRLSRVVDAFPDAWNAANDLAWMLATSPEPTLRDPERAIRLAERSTAQSPGDAGALDTLAAAYAAADRFAPAVATARRALAQSAPDSEAAFRARLSLYLKGLPYVEPSSR